MAGAGAGRMRSRGGEAVQALATHDSWTRRLDHTAVVIRVTSERRRRPGAPAFSAVGSAPTLRAAGAPILLAAAALLVYLLPGASELLEYDRRAILAGDAWRLLTGHWTHLSLDHLVWDALAFAVLGGALALRKGALFWRTVFGSAATISLALLAFGSSWQTYRGLSGIDSALFVALAAWLWLDGKGGRDRWLGGLALALFCCKVGYESLTGATLFTSAAPGHEVVPLAHLAGAVTGMATVALSRRR